MSTDGKSLISDYKASRNLVDPEKALSGFVDKNKKKLYKKMHGRYVARKLSVREMHDDEMEHMLMHQVIHLPFPCETQFIVKEKKNLHYVKFSNGEVFLFLHLVESWGTSRHCTSSSTSSACSSCQHFVCIKQCGT